MLIQWDHVGVLAILAVACASISLTVTRAEIFEPLRARIEKRSEWFGTLFGCPYCFSHWLAAGVVAIFQPLPLQFTPHQWFHHLAEYPVSIFALVSLTAIVVGAITKLME